MNDWYAAANVVDGVPSSEWHLPDERAGWVDVRFEEPRAEGKRIYRLIITYRTGEEVAHASGELWLRAGTGGTADVDVLADQPTTEAHPHRQVAQHAVLAVHRVIATQVGERGLLVVGIQHQFIDDCRPVAHTTAGVEFDTPAYCRRQGGTVDHAQGNKAGGAHRCLHIGHYPTGLVPKLTEQLDAQPTVLLPGHKHRLGVLPQGVKGEPGGAQNTLHILIVGARLGQQCPGKFHGYRFVVELRVMYYFRQSPAIDTQQAGL